MECLDEVVTSLVELIQRLERIGSRHSQSMIVGNDSTCLVVGFLAVKYLFHTVMVGQSPIDCLGASSGSNQPQVIIEQIRPPPFTGVRSQSELLPKSLPRWHIGLPGNNPLAPLR